MMMATWVGRRSGGSISSGAAEAGETLAVMYFGWVRRSLVSRLDSLFVNMAHSFGIDLRDKRRGQPIAAAHTEFYWVPESTGVGKRGPAMCL